MYIEQDYPVKDGEGTIIIPTSRTGGAGGGGAVFASTLTIANGASLSNAIDLGSLRLVAIVMPVAWTPADITFLGSVDGDTYSNVYLGDGVEYSVSADASRLIFIEPIYFSMIRYLQLRSGTAGVPVNQGAARVLTALVS